MTKDDDKQISFVNFRAFNEVFDLKLFQEELLDSLVFSTDPEENLIKEEVVNNVVYVDKEAKTSLIFKESAEGEKFTLEGIVGDSYIITPLLNGPKNKHMLKKLKHEDLANDYLIPEIVTDMKNENQRRRRSAPSVVRPEILVVVDSTLFTKLGRDTAATNQYIRNFWSGVNLRFRTLSNPRVELSIAGIIIAKTPASTPFLKNSKVSANTFNAATALDLMGKHYYMANGMNLPMFDMVITLTDLDMCSMKGSYCNKNTNGYAYVGGACTTDDWHKKINSVAIVEDAGGYSGVVVAAHEVAHLLGAVHDGEAPSAYLSGPGASACSSAGGFIMSNSRHTETGLRWSKCSQDQLSHFLTSPRASCLYNSPHTQPHPLGDHVFPL